MVKVLRLFVLFFALSMILTACVVFIPSNAEAAMNYDQQYYDPYDDIQLVAQEGHFVTGSQWRDLDISQMYLKSETIVTGIPPLTKEDTEISLSVTVRGTVRDEEGFIYAVYLNVGSTEYTLVYTKNKLPIGMNMNDPEDTFSPKVSGLGTSTIVFTVDESEIGSPKAPFKWNAMAIQRADDGNYGDIAPNKLVKITEPWDRSTVFGSITVNGVTRSSVVTYDKVEIQIDSESSSGWTEATDKGGWKNWEYNLDTSLLPDREHDIYVRATDSEGKLHFDDITLSIQQDSNLNPESTDVKPKPHIGDRYVFTISDDISDAPEMINIDISATSDMEATVVGENEKINSYECWKMVTSQSGKLSLGGLDLSFDTDGEIYLENDNFDITREDSNIVITSPITPTEEQHKISEYTPPKVHYDFPIEVSKVWSANTEARIDLDGVVSTENQNIEYRCLFNSEELSVPGGEFETYAIRSQNYDASFYKVEYYAPDIGYPVRIETFDIDDMLIGVLVLSDYDIKDTFIEFSGVIELETGDGEGKIYEKDMIDFKVNVKNSGIGKAENALVVGYYKGVGSGEEKKEFTREEVELKSKSEKTVTLSLQINESGAYVVSFRSFSDSADSVYDAEEDYSDEVVVRLRTVDEESSTSKISTNTLIIGGVVIVIAIIIIIVLVTRKKKETSEYQFVTVEAVSDDSSAYEEELVEVEMAEMISEPEAERVEMISEPEAETVEMISKPEAERVEMISEPEAETEGEEGVKEYQCPACEADLRGDEMECPECKVVFEEYLAGLQDEEDPSKADELLGETVADE